MWRGHWQRANSDPPWRGAVGDSERASGRRPSLPAEQPAAAGSGRTDSAEPVADGRLRTTQNAESAVSITRSSEYSRSVLTTLTTSLVVFAALAGLGGLAFGAFALV